MGEKICSNVSNIEIKFNLNENSTSESRVVYIDRIVADNSLKGFNDSKGDAHSEVHTSIPLTADGSTIGAGKGLSFEIKPLKSTSTYMINLEFQNASGTKVGGQAITSREGLRNTPDYSDLTYIRMQKIADGYWNVVVDPAYFSDAPAKLVFGRWNEAVGLVKNIQII